VVVRKPHCARRVSLPRAQRISLASSASSNSDRSPCCCPACRISRAERRLSGASPSVPRPQATHCCGTRPRAFTPCHLLRWACR
jgi:hypothetical protein